MIGSWAAANKVVKRRVQAWSKCRWWRAPVPVTLICMMVRVLGP